MRTHESKSEVELEIADWEQSDRAKRRATRKAAHRANRQAQRAGHAERKAWRLAPAAPTQLRELRRIASATGRTFCVDISQGEAWRRIRSATVLVAEPARLACAPPWYSSR
jgi:hypothetical protein